MLCITSMCFNDFCFIIMLLVVDNIDNTPMFLQPIVTSTSCSPCGKSAGTPTRAWCTTCGSGNAARSSRGDPRPWPKPYCPCSRRACPCPRPPASTTYPIQRSCCTPTGCTTCSARPPTVAQVRIKHLDLFYFFQILNRTGFSVFFY